jgi:hypothetical protein
MAHQLSKYQKYRLKRSLTAKYCNLRCDVTKLVRVPVTALHGNIRNSLAPPVSNAAVLVPVLAPIDPVNNAVHFAPIPESFDNGGQLNELMEEGYPHAAMRLQYCNVRLKQYYINNFFHVVFCILYKSDEPFDNQQPEVGSGFVRGDDRETWIEEELRRLYHKGGLSRDRLEDVAGMLINLGYRIPKSAR